jgi:hypothetical protein
MSQMSALLTFVRYATNDRFPPIAAIHLDTPMSAMRMEQTKDACSNN